jgi:hypothetical protein
MDKLNKFLANHGIKVIIVLLVLSYLKSCGTSSDVDKIQKDFRAQKEVIDALPTANDLKIEGLKVEKRMIQATDRKMLDVQRQNTIEKEIAELQSK